jgi:Carboxypeptidase regulatory-like domain
MTAKRLITGILSVLVVAAVMAPSLMAQSLVSGDMTGTVTDPSGAVLSGASVTLKSDATGQTRSTTTGSNGNYRFSLLPPGNYTITVNMTGFSKAEEKASVNVGQATVADVKLSVGTSSQTVEVQATAPLVQADSADLSTNFSQTLISNQPNGGNDVTYIAQTSPGAVMNTASGYGNFSVYGLPSTANLFAVNGENDMDPYLNVNNSGATNLTLGRNDLQEVTVVSNAYSGQYGQQAGAQVNYVTKSGTNQFHGNAIYYWNGSSLNANGWINNENGVAKPFSNNNQWAASIGGPIKKDKLFFFLNSEGIFFILPASGSVFTWSPQFTSASEAYIAANAPQELGIYQQYYNLVNQFTSTHAQNPAGADGGCDANLFFTGNCIQQYQANANQNGHEFIASGRLDYNLSDKDHLFWRVRVDQGVQPTSVNFFNNAFAANSYQPAYDGQGQWTHVFGPNATNQFVYAGSYYRAIFTQADPGLFPFDVTSAGPFNLNSVCGACDNFPQGRLVTQYQFVDDFSWTKGNHNFKFGANFRRYDISDYAFSPGVNPTIGVGDQADFFTGLATYTSQNFPNANREPVSIWGLGLYAQDEWRVSKSLKLTFALRGEHNSNPNCHTGCSSLLNSSFAAQAAAGNLSGATPYNQIITTQQEAYKGVDAVNIAPRFGFAWSPGGSDKTVVRGGFGIFYDAFTAILADDFFTNAPGVVPIFYSPSGCASLNGSCVPWGDTSTAASPYIIGATSAAQIKSGFSNGASYNSLIAANPLFSAPSFTSETGTLHTPRYQEWSLGIQQAIGDKASVSLTYVGNHGINQPITDPYLNAFGSPGFAAAATSPAFANFNQVYSGGVSNYNGLTASYNQRLTYGFSVQANYTWSHAMDDVSNAGSTAVFNAGTSPSVAFQLNPNCLSCNNYANADYDIRSYFSASYVWQTPWKFSNKWVNGAAGGWTLSQNFFARSGLPYTVFDGFSGVGNADAFIYGNLTIPNVNQYGQGSCVNPLSQCINASQFTSASSAFGNETRNSFRGPHFFDSDFSINKNFKLTERMAFGVGANFYNVFNHANFDLPVNIFGSPALGTIVNAALPPTGPYGSFFANLPSARVIQFQGKLVF